MIQTPKDYHEKTAYDRHGMGGHYLDWENQPSVYKDYGSSDTVRFNPELPESGDFMSDFIGTRSAEKSPQLSVETIGLVFRRSYRLTASRRDKSGDFYYRSVPSAGALYPFEVYVSTSSVAGLDDGLYHFDIRRFSLTRLRRFAPDSAATPCPNLTFYMSVIFFRSAWKYRERSYRYHLLDTGHLIESVTMALMAMRIPFETEYDFDDCAVNRFLGFDETREVCLAVIRVPANQASPDLPDNSGLFKNASVVSPNETGYPVVNDMHRASHRIVGPPDRPTDMCSKIGPEPTEWIGIREPVAWPEMMTYDQVLSMRRSSRNFVNRTLSESAFNALMWLISGVGGAEDKTVATGFLASGVENLQDGIYLTNRSDRAIGQFKPGSHTERMARVCLDQNWLAMASLHFFIAADLTWLNDTLGARGYRHAMLNAGRLGQRIYAAATSLGLGCCGIGAYYDSEASDLLGLNNSSAMLYLLGVGPVKKMFPAG